MRIVLASDHVGFDLKMEIAAMLKDLGHLVDDVGSDGTGKVDYPVYGRAAGEKLAAGEYDRAILVCGTGFGIALAANKIKGVRCVNCTEPYTALLSRNHNDSNALSLGARVIGSELAKMIVSVWLDGQFEGGRHSHRISMLES